MKNTIKNSIKNKITPCCGLPFSVVYWWISNLTLNSESDRQYLLTQISQSGVLSIDGWKVLINSGTLETDASLTKAEFLAWFDCGKQPSCEQLNLVIDYYKIGNFNPISFEINLLSMANEKELEIQNFNIVENKDIFFQKIDSNNAVVYKSLGGIDWQKINLKNSTVNTSPLKIVSQKAFKIFGYVLPSEAIQTGTWISANSNDSSVYVGHKSLYTHTANNKLTFTKTFGGKLELIFVKSTDCGIIEVKIDGVTVANIDSYSPTTNQWKQSQVVAENLSFGSHTIEIINTGTKNPSSSNIRTWFNALKISDSNINPNSDYIKLKEWKSGESVNQYDERIGANNKTYLATTSGTCGPTQPSHISGTISDGGVSWLVLADSSFSSDEFYVQLEGSELEYAYEALPNGETVKQDIGGNLHGNEELISSELIIDNNIINFNSATPYLFYTGKNIVLKQNIKQYYGTVNNNYEIANVTSYHSFNNKNIHVYADFDFKVQTSVGFFYPAMYPFVAYEGPTQRVNALEYFTTSNSFKLSDFSQTTGLQTNNQKDYIAWLTGKAYVKKGSGGVPSGDNGKGNFLIALKCDSVSLKDYEHSNMNLGIVPNLNNGQYTGYSSWVGKIYFQMASANTPYVFNVNEKYRISNKYYFKLY